LTLEDAERQGILEMKLPLTAPPEKSAGLQKPQLNTRYLGELGKIPRVVDFIMNHRLRKLQRWYKERYELKVFAATFIKRQWNVFKLGKESRLMRRAAVGFMRKKAAISKIAKFSKIIKARKVTAKMQLMLEQIEIQVTELQKQDGFEKKVIKIQKAWRQHRARKTVQGKQIKRNH
jgi:hypothetical protein